MSDILCITNRKLCGEDFLSRIEKLAKAKPQGIILREKDLSKSQYEILARQAIDICAAYDTSCILHTFTDAALSLKAKSLHLPLSLLKQMTEKERKAFSILGASCHSVTDALLAERLGCTYITAGHIFATDCKKGLPGRGVAFLEEVCKSVSIPVYALGGITPENKKEVMKTGAKGVCIMSSAMTCAEPDSYLAKLDSPK